MQQSDAIHRITRRLKVTRLKVMQHDSQTEAQVTHPTTNTNPYANLNLRKQIYMECRAMAEYALARGKPVPVNAIKSIEAFESNHFADPEESQKNLNKIDITDMVETHDALSRIVEPATPQTILLLDIEQETGTFLKFLGPVALVRQLMLAAMASLMVFVGLLASSYITQEALTADVLAADGIEQLARLCFYMSAAGLGASFAALYLANSYISKGTYDPCYQASYWIRFSLGIIGGLLLSILISHDSLESGPSEEASMLSSGVVRPLLAILGGFSADLLHTFLSRMVETFKSLFEGSTQNILDAKMQEGKAKLAGMEVDRRMKMAQNLMKMQQQIGGDTNPEEIKQQMNEILQNLMQQK